MASGNACAQDLAFTGIGDLTGGGFSSGAFGVSSNGLFVVGSSDMDQDGSVAVMWTWDTGLVALGLFLAVAGAVWLLAVVAGLLTLRRARAA